MEEFVLGQIRNSNSPVFMSELQYILCLFIAVKLGIMAGGGNVTDLEEKTFKLISPRLLSIVPEEENADEKQVFILFVLYIFVNNN